jgi:hypothetical protein
MRYKVIYIAAFLFVAIGCKQPYIAPRTSSGANYLVVEGFINTSTNPTDSTVFKLSRTVDLSGKPSSHPELNAIVSIVDTMPAFKFYYDLQDEGNGRYSLGFATGFPAGSKCYLQITTSDGKKYKSDLVDVKTTPPIDSIGYTKLSNGIQLFSNAHDPTANTRYYRWDYTETWQFHSLYQSDYITNGQEIVLRTRDQAIYFCFTSDTSSSIILNSSAKLSKDVIDHNPIVFIPSSSEKIEARYSIMVRQYALSKEAYDFWQNLKKNTEQLGSIFDAQPSEISGNIHCITNPSEPVIGYLSATNAQTKRIFIDNSELPKNWLPTYPYQCENDSLLFCRGMSCINEVALYLIDINSGNIPTNAILSPSGSILGYQASDRTCTDCTVRGTKQQPDFWR